MEKTILVTGAAGAVGAEVVRALCARDRVGEIRTLELPVRRARRVLKPYCGRVRPYWGDLREPSFVAQAVEGVDAVIHLAAMIPPAADDDRVQAASINVGGTEALVAAMREISPGARLIHASSISVYGDRLESPWIEVGDPLCPSPHDAYAETKIEGERLVCESGLWWTIFRLTGVMGPGMSKDPLMFHMPLDTKIEFVTRRDCGQAFAAAIDVDALESRIFDLSGGPSCRTTYREMLNSVFERAGLGRDFFPDEAFAGGNFHCGWYRDSEELDALLHFQRDDLDALFDQMTRDFSSVQVAATRLLRPLIRAVLLRGSEPWIARRRRDDATLARFCLERAPRSRPAALPAE